MKVSSRTMKHFILMIVIGGVIGTLGWEIFERLLQLLGWNMNLTAGPIGFDIAVLAVYLRANPGTLLGSAAGHLLFKKI
ncbi:MAG: hypothetical protein KAU17_01495 [Spirochaetales bacterium]|nr:hypothetical protein [Spirochaetales bacterium]